MPLRPHGDRPLTDAHKTLIRLLARRAVMDFLAETEEGNRKETEGRAANDRTTARRG